MCDYWEEYRVGGLCSKCGRDVDSDGNVEGEVVRILCQNKRDGDGWPPLHAALENGHSEVACNYRWHAARRGALVKLVLPSPHKYGGGIVGACGYRNTQLILVLPSPHKYELKPTDPESTTESVC